MYFLRCQDIQKEDGHRPWAEKAAEANQREKEEAKDRIVYVPPTGIATELYLFNGV